jgi:hypothetical protein
VDLPIGGGGALHNGIELVMVPTKPELLTLVIFGNAAWYRPQPTGGKKARR